jgi:Lrp/AsnC family leucine-responsive transcriptional regulator
LQILRFERTIPPMDDTDLAILRALQADARQPVAEIARSIGLAPSATHERIRKLETEGIIAGYSVRLDARKLDHGQLAFIFVTTSERPHEQRAAEALAKLPEVLEVHHVAGDDCYVLKVRAADATALGLLIRNRLGAIPGLVNTRTTVVLGTVKETGDLPLPPKSREVRHGRG